jgi:hypothetical protein
VRIQFVAKQTVKIALSDKKRLLRLALYSLIELWRIDPTKFSSLIHGMPPASSVSKSIIMNQAGSINYHTSPFPSYYTQNSYIENLTEIIANEADSIYEKMIKDFTNETMANVTASTDSNSKFPIFIYSHEET